MNEQYREDLKNAGYDEYEIGQIEQFLTLLCQPVHGYVVNVFVRCQRLKSYSQIMSACRAAWDATWKHGTPERLGDVDDPLHGENWHAFESIYITLGMDERRFPKML